MNICALSTAKGGAIAVIRVSGPDAIDIAGKTCFPLGGKPLADAKGQSLHYCRFMNGEETVDDVLVSVFRAPHSYTGENSVEISCHASSYIIATILQTLIGNGCRQALPGEYTQRAFLNGKMDLSQAEAVADIIASTNAATHRMAMSQLRGNFSSELAELREKLLHLTTLMELELDFSDHEDLEFADRTELLHLSQTIHDHIKRLADSFKTGQALKHGVPVAIVGKTNVGKSTLLNRLLHEDKAIVSDIHGTTRDVIEDTINLRGIDFRFIDTAGLRATDDKIEQIGIERTRQKLSEATIVLWLIDEDPTAESLSEIKAEIKSTQKLIIVRNKIDTTANFSGAAVLPPVGESEEVGDKFLCRDCPPPVGELEGVLISAKEGINIDLLEEALVRAADIPEIKENDIIVTSARHYEALLKAQEAIQRVLDGMNLGIPTDLLSEDLRLCLSHLADITGGEISTDEVLGNIFSHFCIGK